MRKDVRHDKKSEYSPESPQNSWKHAGPVTMPSLGSLPQRQREILANSTGVGGWTE